jgi:YHS domain-containing protein
MAVEREKAMEFEWQGQTFYFCARGCRNDFASHREQFTG